ncbi:MAG: phage Gp37/Gp68 family protein [Desulfovibrio sp.]|nr:phage Gp37/Gp68 family protein [Desulfovibrio sp.]
MSNNIGWCDCTINPVVGCSKCSPGCENCYAEKFAARMSRNPQTERKYEGVVDANGKWTGKVKVTLDAKTMPHRVPGKNKRVFVGSMSDLFHPNVSDATRDVIFASILGDHIVGNGHGHTFMILTKRAEEMCNYFTLTPPDELLHRWGEAGDGWLTLEGDTSFSEHLESHLSYYKWKTFWPLPNLWVGATICNQEEAEGKIHFLLDTPAARRFLSVEPMLDPITLGDISVCAECGSWVGVKYPRFGTPFCEECGADPVATKLGLGWVICGGESGPGARPMHPDWVRHLRDQCVEAGVPFYFKGWGGTKKTPALLDDREWREFPKQ